MVSYWELQVSSTINSDSSTSMHPHLSSSSSGARPAHFVADRPLSNTAREILKRERAVSSANLKSRSRKSCLKEQGIHPRHRPQPSFKDANRLEWTRRYLYTQEFYLIQLVINVNCSFQNIVHYWGCIISRYDQNVIKINENVYS